ncbi:hypothetical protein FQN50_006846 [Emmonsiellopsis sp. PD_5]|nr:hypothetical protein FQN50_006846 [Emmonsiellopsis sp. PD_5]
MADEHQPPTSTNGAARDYWSEARDRLDEKAKTKLQRISDAASQVHSNTVISWVDQLLHSCQARKEEYERKKWTITVNGKKRSLHSVWDTAINTLSKLDSVGKTVASVHPITSTGWSVTQLLIKIPVEKCEVAQSVAEGISKALVVMSRGLVYEIELQNKWETMDTRNIETFENFLVNLYEETLIFLVAASEHYFAGTFRRTWDAIWDASLIRNFDEKTTNLQRELHDEAETRSRIGVQGDLSVLRSVITIVEAQLNAMQDNISTVVGDQKLKEKEEERKRVLKWLSQFPYDDHHTFAKGERVPGTGYWIFDKVEYKIWRKVKGEILWIHGIPGAGKTKLISRVVDHFREGEQKNDGHLRMAFFYCRKDDDSRRNAVDILRSLIKQLVDPCDVLPREIVEIYRQKSPEDAPSRQLTVNECESMLVDTISDRKNAVLVLDALDECHEDSIEVIISIFTKIANLCNSNTKVILSSRDLPVIQNCLEQGNRIGISASDIERDIGRFVRCRLARDNTSKIPSELRDRIIDTLSRKSKQMFQYATTNLENMLRLPTADDIEDALSNPPESLMEVYRDTFKRIKSDKQWGPYAKRAFQWLCALGGSSRIELLVAAASQKPEKPGLQKALVDADGLVKACQFLLVVEDKRVHFSHLSIQEYFDSQEKEDASHFAGIVLLKALVYYDPETPESSPYFNALHDYACESWVRHVERLEGKRDIDSLLRQLFAPGPPSPGCRHWLLYLTKLIVGGCYSYTSEDLASFVLSPTRWCSYRAILNQRHDGVVSRGKYMLLHAFIAGCFIRAKSAFKGEWWELARPAWRRMGRIPMRLEYSDGMVEARSRASRAASLEERHKEVVHDARMEAKDMFWLFICLILGVVTWTLSVDCSLPDAPGAGVDVFSNVDSSPHTDAGLDQDVNPKDEEIDEMNEFKRLKRMFMVFVDASGLSSKSDDFLSNKMLDFFQSSVSPSKFLEELARVSLLALCHEDYWTTGQLALVDLLFREYDLYRPLRYEYFGIPGSDLYRLAAICVLPRVLPWQFLPAQKESFPIPKTPYQRQIIKFLILNGAGINPIINPKVLGGYGPEKVGVLNRGYMSYEVFRSVQNYPGTLLIATITGDIDGGAEMIEFLLENGADINQKSQRGDYPTALIAACALGQDKTVLRLLESNQQTARVKDVDVNMRVFTGKYGTALIAACANNRTDIVKRLLRNGADPNVQTPTECGGHRTAFAAALNNSNPAIVALLIGNGAKIDEYDGRAIPSTMTEAQRQWDFIGREIYIPIKAKFDDDAEQMEQCTLAAKHLGIALIYSQLDKDMDWAMGLIRLAVQCLSVLSRSGLGDYCASKAVLGYFGLSQTRRDLEVWKEVLKNGAAAMEPCGNWDEWIGELVTLIHCSLEDFEPPPRLLRRESTWDMGSDQELEEFDDDDDDDDDDQDMLLA